MMKNPRLPIWLSAFGFPGLGQFVQRRWFAGILFSSGFLTGFIWILLLAIQNIIELYSMAFNETMADPQPVPISAFGQPLLLVAVVYLVSLFDVFLAQQKIATRQHEEEFLKAHDSSDS